MTVLLKSTRTTVELQPTGASPVLIVGQRESAVAVSLDVNRGLRGETGPTFADVDLGTFN